MSVWNKLGSAASWYWKELNLAQATNVVRRSGMAGKEMYSMLRGAGTGRGKSIMGGAEWGMNRLGTGMSDWGWKGATKSQRAVRLGTAGAAGLGMASMVGGRKRREI